MRTYVLYYIEFLRARKKQHFREEFLGEGEIGVELRHGRFLADGREVLEGGGKLVDGPMQA